MNRAARTLTQTLRKCSFGATQSFLRPRSNIWQSTRTTAAAWSRSVWSTGQNPFAIAHPSGSLTPDEMTAVAQTVKTSLGSSHDVRFIAMTAAEGSKYATNPPRQAEVIVLQDGIGVELLVDVASQTVVSSNKLPKGVQPMFTPEGKKALTVGVEPVQIL